ncbi:MAG: HigA family addiction module antidote protein [bacterium]|nr:HigA family addiction module antidote protein [bacterium]
MSEQELTPIRPGEILKEEFLDPAEISFNRLARDLDVPAGRISEIVNGKRAITADTALRLEKYFGVSAQFWLNLQARYDLKVARRDIWPAIELRVRARPAAVIS